MKTPRLFALFYLLSACLTVGAQPPAADGPSYLLLSHDPVFIEQVSKVSSTVYSVGRTRLVRLTVPLEELPAEIRAALRPVSPGEVYNAPAEQGERTPADPEVLALTSKVNSARLAGYAEAITMSGKRSAHQLDISAASGNRIAMDYIAGAFGGMGYEVERQCYRDRKADKECNILARRKAARPDAKTILVIGHMDSVGHAAAGADDNASGTAGVLEMARILSAYSSDHNFIFVAANGEENGFIGGYACVKKLKASGELARVDWAINMDMIAWDRSGVVYIETNREFAAHANWVGAQARIYTKLKPYISMPASDSDHVPFLEAGIPTYLSIEDWDNHNPCYHKTCDKMEALSWDYAAEVVRLNLAVVAGKARLSLN